MDLQAGVPAAQPLDSDAYGGIGSIGLSLLIVERGGDIDATSRTDDKLPPVLTVEVQQDVALQFAFGQVVGSEHASLFVGGDEGVDGAVLQVFSLEDGHDGGYAQSVVGTECRSVSFYPFAVNPRLDGVSLEVVC